jgi:tetratricopeptide (TPR) repeat protein
MKKLITAVLLLGLSQVALPLDSSVGTKGYAEKISAWRRNELKDVSFRSVYPKPLYRKNYFGLAITGTAVVGAGAFTYFTAGAGAPIAATGVSSVASLIGGGGAGSYMAGLSTLGGWFGGNAMLGSAILNGISIGVVGGGTSFASLPALGKVGVLASVTASAMDGVIVFQNTETKNLSYRIRLTVPEDLGTETVRQLATQLREIEKQMLDADLAKDGASFKQLAARKDAILQATLEIGQSALRDGASNEDQLVLCIIAKNAGKAELFDRLLGKISVATEKMTDTGFVEYLQAVADIERGNPSDATNRLHRSWRNNPYAVEQPLLLINILGSESFRSHEDEIRTIVELATKNFDSEKYATSYSLVSLHYRLATMYLLDHNYSMAEAYFNNAYEKLSIFQKHIGSNSIKSTIRIGIANALYGQNKKDEAIELLGKILSDTKDKSERDYIMSQYAGQI